MKQITGGITAAKGFQAAGIEAGIKYQNRKDMAIIYSEKPCVAAGTFTSNVVKAAPVKWDRKLLEESPYVQAVIVNTGIANAGFITVLGLILGAMMAIDMGGPFNKAAYVFGTAAIASGNYDVMAAVMIGGMVPPCAIALSTILFKNRFTKEERDAGPTNFIMGLAFITEGAIPFAAADPLHVIPACVIGSGVAGALSMLFKCTLMAPHGGIFVFPVVGNAIMYLLALVIGTVISTVLLGVLKKPREA